MHLHAVHCEIFDVKHWDNNEVAIIVLTKSFPDLFDIHILHVNAEINYIFVLHFNRMTSVC